MMMPRRSLEGVCFSPRFSFPRSAWERWFLMLRAAGLAWQDVPVAPSTRSVGHRRSHAERGNEKDRVVSARRGFTLLEVLLTTILSLTLLASLWSLYSIYLRLFETGQARAEQSQLVRALFQQLCDDLHSAIEDSAIKDSPTQDPKGKASGAGGSVSVRRFALFGSQHQLRFDVLQVIPLEETPRLDTDVGEGYRTTPTRQVPELRTIFYTFEQPDAVRDNLGETSENDESQRRIRPGLTRRELDYETPYVDQQQSRGERRFPGAVDSPLGDSGRELPTESSSSDPLDTDPQDDSIMWVPEVAKLEFRYFDGSGWTSQWDSLTRKSLPVAIEVAMQLRPFDESERPEDREAVPDEKQRASQQRELGFEDESNGVEAGARQPRKPPPATYRLLIDLPAANKHPAIKRPAVRPAVRALAAPAPLPVPRAAATQPARRAPPRPAAAAQSKPDQWMRAGP